MDSFYQYSFNELEKLCGASGLQRASASTAYNWYYKKKKTGACESDQLAKKTKDFFQERFSYALPKAVRIVEAADRTVKFLIEMSDGLRVETVLIPFMGKYTACLSSQVGCAMKCSFCFTGTQPLSRSLRTEEIVGQFMVAQHWLMQNRPGDERILNVVYMGQGEPLHNLDNVARSAEILISQSGLSLAAHKITVSTSGYLPGLLRWKEHMPDVNIALSLHSPFAEKRNQLIPINRRYPLEEVLPVVDSIPTGKKRFVTYEYLLLKDFNDGAEDAHATGALLAGKKAFINLIPFNPYPGARYQRPSAERVLEFKAILDTYKVPTTVRTTKGDDVLAACGQLNSKPN